MVPSDRHVFFSSYGPPCPYFCHFRALPLRQLDLEIYTYKEWKESTLHRMSKAIYSKSELMSEIARDIHQGKVDDTAGKHLDGGEWGGRNEP